MDRLFARGLGARLCAVAAVLCACSGGTGPSSSSPQITDLPAERAAVEQHLAEGVGTAADGHPPTTPSDRQGPAAHRLPPAPALAPPPTKMRVVLLGTGTPVPNPKRSGPATAVVVGGHAYLVDYGPGIVRRAAQAAELGVIELDPTGLDFALNTHLHSDHTAGLADLILTPAVVGRRNPLQLLGPPGTRAMARHIGAAYAIDLKIRGHRRSADQMRGYAVQAQDVSAGPVHRAGPLEIRAFEVQHGRFDTAFGYRFDNGQRRVVISGDTAPSQAVVDACNGCDVLVHEVYCQAGFETGSPHFQAYHGAFHTSAPQLAQLARKAQPKLLVLSHLLFFGCTAQQLLAEVRAGYDGAVVVGEDLGIY